MSELTKAKLQDLIKEELSTYQQKNEWNSVIRPRLNEVRSKLLSKGYDRQKVDENFAKSLFGSFMGAGGGAGAEAIGLGGSESLLGGVSGGIRTAIEQTAIEKLVIMAGLDPYSGFGLVLKNAIEQSIKQLSGDEIKSLLSGESGRCQPVSQKLTSIALTSMEEAMKEGVLNIVMEAVLGEFGDDFKKNPLTKPVYQNMREKFSDSFGMMLQDQQLHSDISKMICDNLNVETILGAVGQAGMDDIGQTIQGLGLDNVGSALEEILPEF